MSLEKMAASQQKLRLKMVSIDSWSIREQLCLASAAMHSGDQNWVSVSRTLKSNFAEPNRPVDWLSAKNCALQYNSLLEKTGAHKRKRGERHPSSGSTGSAQGETPGEIIVKQLTQERLEELQQILEALKKEYHQVKKELDLVREGKLDDKLQEISQRIEAENERKILEQSAHVKWLEERERKKQEIQRAFEDQMSVPDAPRSSAKEAQRHPQETLDAGDGSPIVTDQLKINVMTEETPEGGAEETKPVFPAQSSAPASSPLLTEILRSPTSAATPTSSKTTSIVPTKFPFSSNSPRGGGKPGISPGLQNLVDRTISTAGEEIAPKLQTSPVVASTLTRLLELPLNEPGKPLPDLTINQVDTEKCTVTKEELSLENKPEVAEETKTLEVKEEDQQQRIVEKVAEEKVDEVPVAAGTLEVVVAGLEPEISAEEVEDRPKSDVIEDKVNEEPQSELVLSEMKEEEVRQVKVEAADETVETEVEQPICNTEELIETEELEETEITGVEETAVTETQTENEIQQTTKVTEEETVEMKGVTESVEAASVDKVEEVIKSEKDVSTPNEEKVEEKVDGTTADANKMTDVDSTQKVDIETPVSQSKRTLRGRNRKSLANSGAEAESSEEKPKTEPGPATRRGSVRKTQAEEVESEQAEGPFEVGPAAPLTRKKAQPPPPLPLHAPLSSPAPSSGLDSMPNSPTSSISTVTADDEREYRAWKKSIMLVWREISAHKNASLFQKPITEDCAPGYRSLIFRPMDLSTIRKNIESGASRTTTEFHRDLTLMFLNSIIYNPTNNEVYRMAKEMLAECNVIVQEYVNAQLLAQSSEPVRPQRRETRDSARRTESLSSHEETAPSKPEEGKTRAAKRASVAAMADDSKKRRSRANND